MSDTPSPALSVRGVQPGGVLVLEAYYPPQIGRGTGGPDDPDMMSTLADLKEELAGLQFVHDREVREGAYHTGAASIVQVVAWQPNTAHNGV